MKILTVKMLVPGHGVDLFDGERSEALDVVFQNMVADLLAKRRGSGGTFRITLEWTPGSARDCDQPKEEK